MIKNPHSQIGMSLLYRACIAGVGAVALASPALLAPSASAAEPTRVQRMVITGSNIPTAETETATPVLSLDRAKIEQLPVRNVSELLRRLPEANFGGVPEFGNATGFETGASGVSLRGFGTEATLVLINGRRVVSYGDGQNGTDSFVDLNSIPLAEIEKIEVLKDGASAIYGADAVAGVVNILTYRKYRGGELSIGYGNSTTRDSGETTAHAIFGTGDDKTDVHVSFSYFKRSATFNKDRDFSAEAAGMLPDGTPYTTASRNSSPGVYLIPRSVAEALPGITVTTNSALWNNPGVIPAGASTTVSVSAGLGADWSGGPGSLAASDFFYGVDRSELQNRNGANVPRFNFNAFSGLVPATERKGIAGAFEHKAIGEKLRVFGEIMYNSVYSEEVLAPGPISNFGAGFGTPVVVPSTSPWNPFGVDISGSSSFRPTEFGNRVSDITTDWTRLVGGIRGDLDKGWSYESAFVWNESRTLKESTYASAERFNGVLDPANTVGLPYNPFTSSAVPFAPNSAFTDDVSILLKDGTKTLLTSGDIKLSNPQLFDLGTGDIGFATGAEWRRETLLVKPDTFSFANDAIGGGPIDPYEGARTVLAWYGELQIPLVSSEKNIKGLHSLSLNVAGRIEDYSDAGFAGVPKISMRWQPIDEQLTLRASWSQGFKAPSLFESLNPGAAALQIMNNPYNGEQGVEVDILRVGNPNLKPEDSESFTAGAVWSPKFIKGLTLKADYWKTERTGVVDSADFEVLLNQAFANDPDPLNFDAAFAPSEMISGSLNADGSINELVAPFSNTAKQTASGIDFGWVYQIPTEKAGTFTWDVNVTHLLSWKGQDNASTPVEELAGRPSSDAADAYVQWRGNSSVFWDYKQFTLGITGTYIGSYDDTTEADWGFQREVEPYVIMDLQASVRLPHNFKFTVGCNNVLDAEPPITYSTSISAASGYFNSLYSPIGQFWYVNLTKKF